MKRRRKVLSVVSGIILFGMLMTGCHRTDQQESERGGEGEISTAVSEGSEEIPVSETSEDMEPSELTADEYYGQAGKIVSVKKVTDSERIISEKGAAALLSERGFATDNISVNCTIDGKPMLDTTIDIESDETHPLYSMLYYSESELIWNIYVIDGVVFAYPISYNLESERSVPLLITETDTLISHDVETNQYYETIPNEETLMIRKIETINKESLDALTIEGMSTL